MWYEILHVIRKSRAIHLTSLTSTPFGTYSCIKHADCYAWETNCNALHYAMPITTTSIKPWNYTKNKFNRKNFKTFDKNYFSCIFPAFSSFCWENSCLLSDKFVTPCLLSCNTYPSHSYFLVLYEHAGDN